MLAALGLAWLLVKPTELVFVRHGETLANATGHYNAKTLNQFSERGAAGVAALTSRLLAAPRFDRILVSPSPRALLTIAPYLKATHQTAIIWPLLYECCTGHRPKNAAPTHFQYGAKIKIPNDLAGLFVVLPDADRYPVSPSYNAGLAQVEASIKEFKSKFEGGRVLIVGHSGHGGQFLHSFTGRWQKVENTREIAVKLL